MRKPFYANSPYYVPMNCLRQRRGQSNVVGAVLITALLVAGIGSTFIWGIPLIEKNRDRATINIAEDSLSNLNRKITAVARQGGTRTVSFELQDGLLTIETTAMISNSTETLRNLTETDYIQFQTTARAAYITTNRWVPIRENDMQGTSANNYEGSGVLGRDKEGVIIGRSEALTDEFRTTLQLEYRLLKGSDGRGFKVDLVKDGDLRASTSGTKEIIVSQGDTYTRTLNGDPVDVVEVRIRIQE